MLFLNAIRLHIFAVPACGRTAIADWRGPTMAQSPARFDPLNSIAEDNDSAFRRFEPNSPQATRAKILQSKYNLRTEAQS